MTLVSLFQSLMSHVEESSEKYSEDKDSNRIIDAMGTRDTKSDIFFKAGQSKRIWAELHKASIV